MAAKKRTPAPVEDKPRAKTKSEEELERYEVARAEAEKYRPRAEEGLLLARIYDGQARTPWQSVPDDTPENRAAECFVEDADLEEGAKLLAVVLEAFTSGEQQVLKRLQKAAALLRGDPPSISVRRMRFFKRLCGLVVDARRWEADFADQDLIDRYAWARNGLASYVDPAFEGLTATRIREAVLQVDPANLDARSGTTSINRIAAELAIKVRALETDAPDRDSAEHLDRVMQMFRNLRREFANRDDVSGA